MNKTSFDTNFDDITLKVSKIFKVSIIEESDGLLIIWLKHLNELANKFETDLSNYTKNVNEDNYLKVLTTGTKVLVKDNNDSNKYKRGILLAIGKFECITFLMDYGKFAPIPIDSVFELPNEFSLIPCLTFPATFGFQIFNSGTFFDLMKKFNLDVKNGLYAEITDIQQMISFVNLSYEYESGDKVQLIDELSKISSYLPFLDYEIESIIKKKFEDSLCLIDLKSDIQSISAEDFFQNIFQPKLNKEEKGGACCNGYYSDRDEFSSSYNRNEKNAFLVEGSKTTSKNLFNDLLSNVKEIEKDDYVNSWMKNDLKSINYNDIGKDSQIKQINNEIVNKRLEILKKPTDFELQFKEKLKDFLFIPTYNEEFIQGTVLTCLLSLVDLPNVIWCQKAGDLCNNIQESLKIDRSKSNFNLFVNDVPEKGTILGLESENELFRVKFVEMVQQDQISVDFIDWGFSETIYSRNCFLLRKETVYLPKLAFPVYIPDVYFTAESKQFIESLDKSCIALEILETNLSPTSQNPIIVDFQVLEEDLTTFTSLKQLLISNNFLEQKIEKLTANDFEIDLMSDDYNSIRNSYNVDTHNPSTVFYNYDTNKNQEVCLQFKKKGWCSRGHFCKFQHIRQQRTFTTDSKIILKPTWNYKYEKKTFVVYVTCYFSPSRMFVKILDIEGNTSNSMSENFNSLNELESEISNTLKKRQNTLELYTSGELVAYHSLLLNRPIRGTILEISDYLGCKGQCETYEFNIFAIDYGFEEKVDERNIFLLKDPFIHYPPTCMEVSLQIESKEKKWCRKDKNLLQNKLQTNAPHIIEVTEKLYDKYYVNMFDSRDGSDIAKWCLQNLNACIS